MHTRQSGAAHVPIMFFLMLLVIFLGTLGFAYVTLTKNGELMKERDDAKAEAKVINDKAVLVDHYIQDIGRVIGKPGVYVGREASKTIYGDATLTSDGVMNPAEIKRVLDEACGLAGVSVATSLENVLSSMVTRVNFMAQRVKDIEAERDKAMTEKNEVDSKFNSAATANATMARENSQTLDEVRAEFTTAKSSKDSTITNLQMNVQNKDQKIIETQEAAAALEKDLRQQIAKVKMQNSALTSREALRQPANVADGKIIAARTGVKTAFINLGKKDLLQPDTMFRIKNPRSEAVKGYAKVIRVEEERAEVELSGIADPIGDYVREGDQLYNDLYTPGMSRTIYLMGRFGAPYNKDTLSTLLKNLGNKVVTRMVPGVDTVILGNDPLTEEGDGLAPLQDSAEYKEAVDLRVEFASLLKIRDLIAPAR